MLVVKSYIVSLLLTCCNVKQSLMHQISQKKVLISLTLSAGLLTANIVVAAETVTVSQQKQALEDVIADYPLLFNHHDNDDIHYDNTSGTFNDKILENPGAIQELYELSSLIRTVRTLPYYVTDDARRFRVTMSDRINNVAPISTYNRLWEKAIEKSQGGFSAYSKAQTLNILLEASLTGPKLGLDIATGGFARAGKAIVSTGKKVRKIKVVKSIRKVKSALSTEQLRKITKALKKVDKAVLKTLKLKSNLKTDQAKAVIAMFESDAYTLLVNLALDNSKLAVVLSKLSDKDRDIITKYTTDHKDDDLNYVAQFFVEGAAADATVLTELFASSKVAMFSQIVQTGLLSLIFDDDLETDLTQGLITATLKMAGAAAEFIPIAGPFVELYNVNVNAASLRREEQAFAIETAQAYTNYRLNFVDLQLHMYRLMVLEGIIYAIRNNTGIEPVEDSLEINEYFGVVASINNIAAALRATPRNVASQIFDGLYDCRVSEIQHRHSGVTTIPTSKIINERVSITCDPQQNYFLARVSQQRGQLGSEFDIKLELYVEVDSITLYKLPSNGFVDVKPGSYYYPIIGLLEYENRLESNDHFYPEQRLTELGMLKLLTQVFYKQEFSHYKNTSSFSEERVYYEFFKVKWSKSDVVSPEYRDKDKQATRIFAANAVYYYLRNNHGLPLTNIPIGEQTSRKISVTINDKVRYFDVTLDTVNGWHFTAAFLRSTGIAGGYLDGTYGSAKIITKGEALSLLFKTYEFEKENQ